MPRTAIFGDVSGHLPPLTAALSALGVDVDAARMPDDLTVVQVGDLVHKGPDGDALVALADRMMAAHPRRWIQLLGNHEAQHLDGPAFGWCSCSMATVDTLRSWLHRCAARLAVAVESVDDGPLLVTHAGLTRRLWTDLGADRDVHRVVDRLQAQLAQDRLAAFAPGRLLPVVPGQRAGVIWAVAGDELYASWAGHRAWFGQVHGHTSAYHWERRRWWSGTPSLVEATAELDSTSRHLRVVLGGRPFLGIDPGWDHHPPPGPMSPLVVPTA